MLPSYNAQATREQVSPVDFLARLGYHPAYKSGKDFFYLSMLREERSISLCVDDELGVWFDDGGPNPSGIKGGNLIDLARAYWHPIGFLEAVDKINKIYSTDSNAVNAVASRKRARARIAHKLPHYQLMENKPLGNNASITNYLRERGIWHVARPHIRELYYYIEDEKKRRKHFFSAGWQNENGGWQVASPCFEGCLGHNGLTVIPGQSDSVAFFGNMIDYKSWLLAEKETGATIIILNTWTMLEAAIKRAAFFRRRAIYFDNNATGLDATNLILQSYPDAVNGSYQYRGYKDFNELITRELNSFSPRQ
jgi:hypothetical protein